MPICGPGKREPLLAACPVAVASSERNRPPNAGSLPRPKVSSVPKIVGIPTARAASAKRTIP